MASETTNNFSGDIFEKKVEQIMITRIQFFIGIMAFIVPVICFFYKIQLDVGLIKQNHEAHMQAALEKIAILEADEEKRDTRLEKQNEAIIRLLTIHPQIKE